MYPHKVTENDVHIHDQWITVDGLGRIGMYINDIKEIGLDYSMKMIVGTNERIPCTNDPMDIRTKIVKLFNKT